jgi:aminopeptidase-like protein
MTQELEAYFDRLWPICRSITGDGLRQSFAILNEIMPMHLVEVPSGTKIFDWEVPLEWNIHDAYIITPNGEKIADFKKNNLHLMSYSLPIDGTFTFEELAPHLHYLEDRPDAIPYLTSYYHPRWGFGITYNQYKNLPREGVYRVVIDSQLKEGSLTYGEAYLQGETYREVLFSSYLCHPSMANNELSGPIALAFLYKILAELPYRKYSYRFVLAPETIGTLCMLHERGDYLLRHLDAGFVVSCCADTGQLNYKYSRRGDTLADKAAMHVLKNRVSHFGSRDFDPTGSDERQYGSPGFNLPVGVINRTPDSQFPEYHTSHDNKDFISFDALQNTIQTLFEIAKTIELTGPLLGTVQYGEPRLGNRGLYADLNGKPSPPEFLLRRKRILNFSDGITDMLDMSEKYGYYLPDLKEEFELLRSAGLIH